MKLPDGSPLGKVRTPNRQQRRQKCLMREPPAPILRPPHARPRARPAGGAHPRRTSVDTTCQVRKAEARTARVRPMLPPARPRGMCPECLQFRDPDLRSAVPTPPCRARESSCARRWIRSSCSGHDVFSSPLADPADACLRDPPTGAGSVTETVNHKPRRSRKG